MGYFLKRALKRFTVAVFLIWTAMLAAAIANADTTAPLKPTAPPNKAKPFSVPQPVRAEHGGPVTINGQETIYDSKTDTFVVKGDAVMSQGGSVLKADEIDIMRRDRTATAIGHVHLIHTEGDERRENGDQDHRQHDGASDDQT